MLCFLLLCFQEVDRFHDMEEQLNSMGYNGIWKVCYLMIFRDKNSILTVTSVFCLYSTQKWHAFTWCACKQPCPGEQNSWLIYWPILQMRTGRAIDGCAIFWRTSRQLYLHILLIYSGVRSNLLTGVRSNLLTGDLVLYFIYCMNLINYHLKQEVSCLFYCCCYAFCYFQDPCYIILAFLMCKQLITFHFKAMK